MYVYHERHIDAHGKLVLTELRISSYGNGRLSINFRNAVENTKFEVCKQILKWPPVIMRSYDEASKVWSYLENYGDLVLEKLREVCKPLGGIIEYEVEDLQAQCLQGQIDFGRSKKQKIRPEDFFYNTSPASAPALTKEQLREKLAVLMETNTAHLNSIESNKDALKKLYRHAAMRLHPDRNNGDGSRMSDLNMYWRLYNA